MATSEITTAITNIGFPIVMCLIMCWFMKYLIDKQREELNSINETHKTEMDNMTQALNNNTVILQKLCDMLDKGGNENAIS